MKSLLLAALAALLLTGCIFNDDNAEEFVRGPVEPIVGPVQPSPTIAFCDSIVGGSSVTTAFTPGCLDCSVSEPARVADDEARTFASLSINDAPTTQGGSIRVSAQSGVAYPAGRKAGAYLTIPEQSGGTQLQLASSNAIAIRTYLAGALQEETSALTEPRLQLQSISGDPELPESYVYFTTSKLFDAVELFISNSQTTVGTGGVSRTPAYKVYELCSDGGLR